MTSATTTAPAATTPVTQAAVQLLGLKRAISAFEAWESGYRAKSEAFYTPEETAAMAVATVSEERAIYFMALLRDGAPATDTPPANGEIWPGQGGRFICTVGASHGLPARHLIAGEDEAEDLEYGPYLDVPGATSHIDGRANTAALLATGEKHPAAEYASAYTADGHTDFHLPSQHDLFMAMVHAREHFKKDGYYRSSTQDSRSSAFVQGFEGGSSGWYGKGLEFRVRAFRWVLLST